MTTRHGHPPLFGTNGVRGLFNHTLTLELALRLGRALGTHFEGGRVLVGGDPRLSTPLVKAAVTAGLGSAGCTVVDGGTAPTPALQYTLKQGGFDGGAIITASHNPPEWNGIKAVEPDGTEMRREEEEAIEAVYYEERFRAASWQDLHEPRRDPGVNDRYVDAVLKAVDAAAIARARLRVVVDCSNGAACFTTPYLLQRLGCKVVALNAQPDGTFPGHHSEPTPDNAQQLLSAVRAAGADLGCLHDGDADRAIFADERARYVQGDQTFALLAAERVRARGGGVVVTPVSSSNAVEDLVKAAGGRVVYTRVGSPVVAHRMKAEGAVFGGEENGGVLFPEHQHVRDGLRTVAGILELMAAKGKTLSALLADVPRYVNVKTKIHVEEQHRAEVLRRYASSQRGRVDATDGVKVLGEEGWVLVRPSGTEPLVRIFAEARDEATARRLADGARAELEALQRTL